MGSCDNLLASLKKAQTSAGNWPEFVQFWLLHRDEILGCIDGGELESEFIETLDASLNSKPAHGLFGRDIDSAAADQLRQLDCAYDIWRVLADRGRRRYLRGKRRDWYTHEEPLIESYRWQVKAKLAGARPDRVRMIACYRKAAEAAQRGSKYRVLRNRARHMEAFALAHQGHSHLGAGNLEGAIPLFEAASKLTPDTGHGTLNGFYAAITRIRWHEVQLRTDEALRAHSAALGLMNRMNAPNLFRRPNPWTSPQDLRNESQFIELLAALKEQGSGFARSAIAILTPLAQNCSVSARRRHLECVLWALLGVAAIVDQNATALGDSVAQLQKETKRPGVRSNDYELLLLLQDHTLQEQPDDLVSEMLPFLPMDAEGRRRPADSLLYGAPRWLQVLWNLDSAEAKRLAIRWFTVITLDYVWAIYEKWCGERGVSPRPRPALHELAPADLASVSSWLERTFPWNPGTTLDALEALASGLEPLLLDDYDGPAETASRTFVRSVEPIFPLAVEITSSTSTEVKLKRLDPEARTFNYEVDEVDTASSKTDRSAYLKSRFRNWDRRPKEAGRLYLYRASSLPRLRCSLLIVEGVSDEAFFQELLDMREPGWRHLRCEDHPERSAIEIREAGGGDNIPQIYRDARSSMRFHDHPPSREAESTRIVVVVDEDRRRHLISGREDVARCPHRVVLQPDLERMSLPALKYATAIVAGNLSAADELFLDRSRQLDADEFEGEFVRRFKVSLKNVNKGDALSIPVELARHLPHADSRSSSCRVTEVTDLLLSLALGFASKEGLTRL